jgi:hypothetical protein
MSASQPNGTFERIEPDRFLDLSESGGPSTALIFPFGKRWHSVEIKTDGLEHFLKRYGSQPDGARESDPVIPAPPIYNRPWTPLAIALDLARNWRVRGDGAPHHLQDGLSDQELEFRGINARPVVDRASIIQGNAVDVSGRLAIQQQKASQELAAPIIDGGAVSNPLPADDALASVKRRGRPRGAGSYERADAPLLQEMKNLIDEGSAKSVNEAAGLIARKAPGATLDSKAARLRKSYVAKFPR